MNPDQSLLPPPKSFAQHSGNLPEPTFTPNLPDACKHMIPLFPDLFTTSPRSLPLHATISNHEPNNAHTIIAETNNLTINAADNTGLFHALQTLRQITRNRKTPTPCFTIHDAPDLPIRGLSLDVSRGRVPKLQTLLRLTNRLAQLKINHLQLYVEHTFAFSFDPDISHNCSPLTANDIRTLDKYCRDRFIDLVPSLATFGHMGRILSLPQYQHLAEIPTNTPWENQTWLQRQRGLTIDVTNPDSQELLTKMLDEFLPLFSSKLANVCADETHDLGQGRNKSLAEKVGTGRLYVDHLKFLADSCRRHGKRMMFWGDIIRNHPELLCELPEDAILLDWGYEPDSEFPALTSPHRRNRDVIACPGTSGWKRVINDFTAAQTNISKAANAAHTQHATGLIVTDWGDDGHFNLPACSLPAIALTASLAWNQNALQSPTLDHAINNWLFPKGPGDMFAALKNVSRPLAGSLSWPTLQQLDNTDPLPLEHAQTLQTAAQIALQRLHQCDPSNPEIEEWLLACHAAGLIADRPLISSSQWSRELGTLITDYETCWLQNNKPDRLHDITHALKNARIQ